MSNIENASRVPFFPNNRDSNNIGLKRTNSSKILERNNLDRVNEINNTTQDDVKVTIPESIKDYSRIKKAVDASPEIDQTEKIATLKQQINQGTYKVDYEGLADRLLSTEF